MVNVFLVFPAIFFCVTNQCVSIRSTVINRMREALSSDSLVAFFYCSRSTAELERAQPVEILSALLRQLASSKPDVPIRDSVAKEYESRKKKADEDCSQLKKLTVKDCVNLILQLNAERPAMIIIDALDECDNYTRHELLEGLDTIISQSDNLVKVFVSGRDDVDIVSVLSFIGPSQLRVECIYVEV